MAGDDAGRWPSEELPAAWCWVDFATFFSDFTDSHRKVPQKQYKQDGELAIVDQGTTRIGGYTDDLSMQSSTPLPAIVFGDHTRAVKFIDIPFAQGADGVRVLAPNRHVEPVFAYHALRCLELPDKGYSRHFKFLKASRFPLPPLPEQRRIVAKIDSLTGKSRRARDHFDHIPRLVEKYKQAVLAAAFRGDLTRAWRDAKDDPSSLSLVSKLKDHALVKRRSSAATRNLVDQKTIPLCWSMCRMEDVCSEVVDGTHHTPTYVENGIPFISVKDVRCGSVDFSETKMISETEHEELANRCAPRLNDVLITKSGTIGRCAVVTTEQPFSLFVSVAMVRPATSGLRPHYLKYAFEYWVSTIDVSSEITGTAVKNLHLQDIKALGVPVPSTAEQDQIILRLDCAIRWMDRIASEATSALRLIDRLDQAVLTKAFLGELVPQDPADEPASELLERIRAESAAATPKAKRSRKTNRPAQASTAET